MPLLLLLACFAFSDDISTLKSNIVAFITAEGADTSNVTIKQTLTDLETSARTIMKSCYPRGGWSDINYAQPLAIGGEWQAIKHYERMKQMSIAYCTKGQSLYNSDSLKTAIELALDTIHDNVYSGVSRINNWWYWFQGIPMFYGPTLLLMQGKIDSSIHAEAVTTLKWCLDLPSPSSNPGDMVTQALGLLYYGAVSGEVSYLSRAKTLAQGDLTIRNSMGDGILSDYSCIHHMDQLYIGGYGAQVAADGPKYLIYTAGTSYTLGQSYLDASTNFNAHGTAWSLDNVYYDISTIGRNVTRASQLANSTYGLTALLLSSAYSSPFQNRFISASKKMLESWTASVPIELAGYISTVSASPVVSSWPIGHRNFFMSYFTVHKRADYHFSVKMMAPGITGSELVNNEGKKSWHLSDGMTYILRKGDEYNINNVIATLDWNRLPGITVQKKAYPSGEVHSNSKAFVGGVECGTFGTSAMDFSSSGELVTAKKSWHFFDNEIICLGSNIDCPSTDTVETIINQRPLSNATEPLIADGAIISNTLPWSGKLPGIKWAFCDSIGYYFPGGADISAKMASQSGRWSDIGIGDATTRTNNFSTIWFNHGTNVNNGSYSYAVLPNKSAFDISAYSASPAFRVIENSDTLHAVENSSLRAVSAVFWKKGEITLLRSDSPSIVFCRETEDSLYFSASYPPKKSVELRFNIDRPLALISSTLSPTVSTDSIRTILTFRTPGNGNGINAIFRKIKKGFGYVQCVVADSATGSPLRGALCTIKEERPNSSHTDSSGRTIVKADTGTNTLTITANGYRPFHESQITININDTIRRNISLSRLPVIGVKILPERSTASLSDSMKLTLVQVYGDSSVKPAAGQLFWTSQTPSLATVDQSGFFRTLFSDGTVSVSCSSAILNMATSIDIYIRPVYRIMPSADAYIRGGTYSSANYGNDSILVLKNNGDPAYSRKVFLKFSLSSIRHAKIDSARFFGYFGDATSSKISIYRVTNDLWYENQINWNNAPLFSSIIDTIKLISIPGWKSQTLGGSISEEFNGDKVASIALFNDAADDLYPTMKSRESAVHSPYIEIYASGSITEVFKQNVNDFFSINIAPNPFNPTTSIHYHGHNPANTMKISIFDISGRTIHCQTYNQEKSSGVITWNAEKNAAGLYIIEVISGKVIFNEKLLLIK
ncbi:MAG: DNRLRE domain-containing protein [Fibrobacteres bacterium]|nr:DNRLRE domain-containing protein [Fibrobacterota bacterium]